MSCDQHPQLPASDGHFSASAQPLRPLSHTHTRTHGEEATSAQADAHHAEGGSCPSPTVPLERVALKKPTASRANKPAILSIFSAEIQPRGGEWSSTTLFLPIFFFSFLLSSSSFNSAPRGPLLFLLLFFFCKQFTGMWDKTTAGSVVRRKEPARCP